MDDILIQYCTQHLRFDKNYSFSYYSPRHQMNVFLGVIFSEIESGKQIWSSKFRRPPSFDCDDPFRRSTHIDVEDLNGQNEIRIYYRRINLKEEKERSIEDGVNGVYTRIVERRCNEKFPECAERLLSIPSKTLDDY